MNFLLLRRGNLVYLKKVYQRVNHKENTMPARGGRVGGGSRGGGFRAPRVSSGGSRGARINIGTRAPRVASSAPSANVTDSTPHPHVYHRPWWRRGTSSPLGGSVWRIVGIIIALFFFGMCACVALGFALQYFGYGV